MFSLADLIRRVDRLENIHAMPPLRVDTTPAGNVISLIEDTTDGSGAFSGAAVTASASQVNDGTGLPPLSFDTVTFDTGGYTGSPTRLAAVGAGYYLFGASVGVGGATGQIPELFGVYFGPVGPVAAAAGYIGGSVLPGVGNVNLCIVGLCHLVGASGYIEFRLADRSGSLAGFTVAAGAGAWMTQVG